MSATQGRRPEPAIAPAHHPLETALKLAKEVLADGTSDRRVGEQVVHLDMELSKPD